MKIGEVAKQTGLSVKSIRYYHDIGLVCGGRNEAGYRVYRQQDIESLKFVHQCRDLGFSLEDFICAAVQMHYPAQVLVAYPQG